jgi:drug/metabolite transporter (DMT)-like permease
MSDPRARTLMPAADAPLPLTAVAGAMALCILFGGNAVAIKVSLLGVGAFTAAGIRFAMAAVVISCWARLTGRPLGLKPGQWRPIAVLAAIFTVQLSLIYLGLSCTDAVRAVLIINMQPFFVLLLAHFFIPGDRLTGRKLTGMALGFGGVVVLFLNPAAIRTGFRLGDVIIMAASVLWAVNGVYTKRVIADFRPFQVVLYPMAIGAPLFFTAGFVWDQEMIGRLSASVVTALLYQGLVTASFGFVAWHYLLRRYGVVSMHAFVFLMPVSGVLLGGLILGEPVTPRILAAMVMIAGGILVIHVHPRKPPPVLPLGRDL